MSYIDVEQGSAAWMQERMGCATGSRIRDALALLKNGQPSQKRMDYAVEMLAERLTGSTAEHYVSREMEWGSAYEKQAVAAYELRTGLETDKCGIFRHDLIEHFAASPDRLIGEDGLLEVKCPKTSTHIAWMLADVIPEEHTLQLTAELACSNRAWVDFVSYDPRLPLRHQLFIKRMHAENSVIALMLDAVSQFLGEVDALEASLNERNPPVAAPEEEDAWDTQALLSNEAVDEFFDKMAAKASGMDDRGGAYEEDAR